MPGKGDIQGKQSGNKKRKNGGYSKSSSTKSTGKSTGTSNKKGDKEPKGMWERAKLDAAYAHADKDTGTFKKGLSMLGALVGEAFGGVGKQPTMADVKSKRRKYLRKKKREKKRKKSTSDAGAKRRKTLRERRRPFETATGMSGIIDPLPWSPKKNKKDK